MLLVRCPSRFALTLSPALGLFFLGFEGLCPLGKEDKAFGLWIELVPLSWDGGEEQREVDRGGGEGTVASLGLGWRGRLLEDEGRGRAWPTLLSNFVL